MLPIAGKPLLRWLVDAFKVQGINDITVVGGYRADAIDVAGMTLVVNERYAHSGELASLVCAADALRGDAVISYGDLLFRSYILRDLVDSDATFSVVVDSSQTSNQSVRDFAYCSAPDNRDLFGQKVWLRRVSSDRMPDAHEPDGLWIGLFKVRAAGCERLQQTLAEMRTRSDFDALDMPALLNALIDAGEAIEVQYVHGHWRGVNDLEDFHRAGDFAHTQAPFAADGSSKGEV
jgi:phosphoenolpyruvate phosphomutase